MWAVRRVGARVERPGQSDAASDERARPRRRPSATPASRARTRRAPATYGRAGREDEHDVTGRTARAPARGRTPGPARRRRPAAGRPSSPARAPSRTRPAAERQHARPTPTSHAPTSAPHTASHDADPRRDGRPTTRPGRPPARRDVAPRRGPGPQHERPGEHDGPGQATDQRELAGVGAERDGSGGERHRATAPQPATGSTAPHASASAFPAGAPGPSARTSRAAAWRRSHSGA